MGSVTGVLSISAAAYGVLPLKPRLPGVPFVFQAHGTSLGEVLSKWRSRRPKALLTSFRNLLWIFKDLYAYPRFDAVVAVGSAVVAELRRPPIRWALPADRIRLIRNGIDTSAFARAPAVRERMRRNLGLGEGERLVVSASRLHRQKGVDLGLRAFARLAGDDPAVRYLIVGDGPERGELEALSRALGVMDRVIFAGAIAREQLPQWLQAGDAFLFTTTRAEVGATLNVLEALAVGLPAVVSDSLHSVIEISPAVQGVNPSDTVAVAEALRRALAIGPQPGRLLPEPYTLDHCARQYRRVLGAGEHV
jgi:glycosyltransferase involved in cell wall biosynthesis